MVNRNTGSGTRILIDRLLGGARPPGYGVQTKSHNAVAAAVRAGARRLGCGDRAPSRDRTAWASCRCRRSTTTSSFPVRAPAATAVKAFRDVLNDAAMRERLRAIGFDVSR